MSGSGAAISAVVCTYNGEKYLREQLQSILEQTRPPDEIIISDDGSTDSTLEVVEEVRSRTGPAKTPVWKVLTRKRPLGVSGNFASALGEAQGDLIALADQDDVWETDRLEKVLKLFGDDVLLVHSDATLIDESGKKTGTLMSALRLTRGERKNLVTGRALDVVLRRNVVTGATTMIRSSLLQQALPIPEGWVHDEWLALVAAAQGGVVFSEDPLIRYRQHGDNEIGATKTDYEEATRRLREKRGEFFQRKLRRNEGISALIAQQPLWLGAIARDALEGKIEFDLWRSRLPASRLKRVAPVLTRWVSQDYSRFARGYLDVVRDISLTD
jgi:glycosyltransferase involved in cell wall biosynthesis